MKADADLGEMQEISLNATDAATSGLIDCFSLFSQTFCCDWPKSFLFVGLLKEGFYLVVMWSPRNIFVSLSWLHTLILRVFMPQDQFVSSKY